MRLPISAKLKDYAPDVNHQLEAADSQSTAAMELTLEWQSENALHTDCVVAEKLNLRRDILPGSLENQIMGKGAGHVASQAFAVGEFVPHWMPEKHLELSAAAFHRRLRRYHYTEPRRGRFYPRAYIAGVADIFPENMTPFRVTAVNGGLNADLNHPLAGRAATLSARLLDVWRDEHERGGRCIDLVDLVTQDGAGMQTRWRGQPTDFFSELPFTRLASEPDNEFYSQARLVDHIDRTATTQIESLYGSLIPRGARVLDLMTSWKSHLPASLHLTDVSGLGMNLEELHLNPRLNTRLVHDLNLVPRLPFDDQQYDAVVCTVSVEYLTKPIEVFAEVHRVLRPGGLFVLSFSNRWFPPKVVKIWQDLHEFERPALVLEYFILAGGFNDLETFSICGLPRPSDDKYADRLAHSDPVYAVWGRRQ